jgi:hypothetical protein
MSSGIKLIPYCLYTATISTSFITVLLDAPAGLPDRLGRSAGCRNTDISVMVCIPSLDGSQTLYEK